MGVGWVGYESSNLVGWNLDRMFGLIGLAYDAAPPPLCDCASLQPTHAANTVRKQPEGTDLWFSHSTEADLSAWV